MSNESPYVFFSYARIDYDPYLRNFFKDLQQKLLQLETEQRIGVFRDSKCIDAGDDWNSKLSRALQTSQVLVCIYTAQIFGSEYCGKELAAFLKRNDDLTYEEVPYADGTIHHQLREPRNIIPILWGVGENDLASDADLKKKMPPPMVRRINYTLKEDDSWPFRAAQDYRKHGLRRMYIKRPSATRDDVVKYFANQILGASPLPSPDQPFTFEELWDAFWKVQPGYLARSAEPDTQVDAPDVAAPEPVPPRQADLLAIEITPRSDGTGGWAPYSKGPALATAVQEIAYADRRAFSHLLLDPNSEDFAARASSAVEEATQNAAIPILFVNPRCLEQHRPTIVSLLQRKWSGGIILPADRSDQEAVRLVRSSLPDLERPGVEGARIVVRASIGTMGTFRTAVNSVAMQTFCRISETGQVQRKPRQQEGPDVRPRITNFMNSAPSEASTQ